MKKFNIYSILAAIIAIIGNFVPYYYISWYYAGWNRYTVTLFTEEVIGIAILIVAALILLFALIRKRVPLIIFTIILIITELIFIFVALNQGEIFIFSVPETGVLLLPGFYMAVAVVILSIVSIVKDKEFSNKQL